jgi:hypothetical protein
MLLVISMLIAATVGTLGYIKTRQFVASRLRFVDSAQSRALPVIAGVGAALLAAPIVALLPVVGTGTVLSLGIGVGMGAAVGAKDIRLARYKVDS